MLPELILVILQFTEKFVNLLLNHAKASFKTYITFSIAHLFCLHSFIGYLAKRKWLMCQLSTVGIYKNDAGSDPETLEVAFHQGPEFINADCKASTSLVDQD